MQQSFVITPPTYGDSPVNRGIPLTDAISKKNIFHTPWSSRSSFMLKMNKNKVAILGFDKIRNSKVASCVFGGNKKNKLPASSFFFLQKSGLRNTCSFFFSLRMNLETISAHLDYILFYVSVTDSQSLLVLQEFINHIKVGTCTGPGTWLIVHTKLVMGIGWIFIIDHRFKVNERLSIIIG